MAEKAVWEPYAVNAVCLLFAILIADQFAAPRRERPASSPCAEDLRGLATRPLPAGLRIYPHPREIPPCRVREITGGRIG